MAYSREDKARLLKYHGIDYGRIDDLPDSDYNDLAQRAGGSIPNVDIYDFQQWNALNGGGQDTQPQPEPQPEPEPQSRGYSIDSVQRQLEAKYGMAGNRVLTWLRGDEGANFIKDQLTRFEGDEQKSINAMASAMSQLFPEARVVEELEKLPEEQSNALRSHLQEFGVLNDPAMAENVLSNLGNLGEALVSGDTARVQEIYQSGMPPSGNDIANEAQQLYQSGVDSYGQGWGAEHGGWTARRYSELRNSGMGAFEAQQQVAQELQGRMNPEPVASPTEPTAPPETLPPRTQPDGQQAFDEGGFQGYLDYVNSTQDTQPPGEPHVGTGAPNTTTGAPSGSGGTQPPPNVPTQQGGQDAFDQGGFQAFLDYVQNFQNQINSQPASPPHQGTGEPNTTTGASSGSNPNWPPSVEDLAGDGGGQQPPGGGQQPPPGTQQPPAGGGGPSPNTDFDSSGSQWESPVTGGLTFDQARGMVASSATSMPRTSVENSDVSGFQNYLSSTTLDRPDFNLDEAVKESDAEIDLLFGESAKALQRQFQLTPGGTDQGGAIDKFEELHAGANQQKLQRRQQLRQQKLQTDMALYQFDTQTLQRAQEHADNFGLSKAQFEENQKQFQDQMAQSMVEYAGNLGLSQRQFNEAVRQYNDQSEYRDKAFDETIRQYNEELKYRYTEMYGGAPSVSYTQSEWNDAWGKSRGEAGYKPSLDIDGDGTITRGDFTQVAVNSKEISPGVYQYIPEGPRTLTAQRLDYDYAKLGGELGLSRDQLDFAKETTANALTEEKRQFNSNLTGFLYNDDGTIQTQPGQELQYVEYEGTQNGTTFKGKLPIMVATEERVASVQRDTFNEGVKQNNERMNFNLNTFLKNAGMTSADIADLDPYSKLGVASTITNIQYGGTAAGQSAAGYGQQPEGEGFDFLGWAALAVQAGGRDVLGGLLTVGSNWVGSGQTGGKIPGSGKDPSDKRTALPEDGN